VKANLLAKIRVFRLGLRREDDGLFPLERRGRLVIGRNEIIKRRDYIENFASCANQLRQ
jgi:hypothetical protein